jgi:hypothetical protein
MSLLEIFVDQARTPRGPSAIFTRSVEVVESESEGKQ